MTTTKSAPVRADEAIFAETAEKLRETVRQGQSLEAAQVKVIGLADIRAAAGDRWPKMAARVRETSMNFLQSHLRVSDVVIPAGDGFLVIYGQGDGRDLARDSENLREALNAFYLGEEGMASLRAQVDRATLDARAVAAMLGDAPRTAAFEIGFLPVWSVAQEAIVGYVAGPVSTVNGVARLACATPWRATGAHDGVDQLELDLALLDRVVAEAKACVATNKRCLIVYSVHTTTMQQRERRETYMARAHAIPALVRPYLLAQIAELEPGAPAIIVADWVHRLRMVTPRVSLELHPSEQALRGFDGTGAHGVSCAIPEARTREEITLAKRLVDVWTPALKRQGLKYRLDNVVNPRLLTMAIAAGVDMITCERYWPIVDAPEGARLYPRQQLHEAIAPALAPLASAAVHAAP